MTTQKPTLQDQFQLFESEAFRLEVRPRFLIPEEAEALRAFAAGKPKPPVPAHQEWLDLVQTLAARDRRIRRVRLLSRDPTDYERFELEYGYPYSIRAGEEISLLSRDEFLADVPSETVDDFWMFDETRAFLLIYDHSGRFDHAEAVASDDIAPFRELRQLALSRARSYRPPFGADG